MTAIFRPRLAAMPSFWVSKVRNAFAMMRSHPLNTIVSLVVLALMVRIAWILVSWGVINAAWSEDASSCAGLAGRGACWAVVANMFRYILFGSYPYEEQWRPAIGVAGVVMAMLISAWPTLWGRRLAALWIVALGVFFALMSGGIAGLRVVPAAQWGGLPLTLVLSIVGGLAALPLGIGLALARRSPIRSLRTTSIFYIETIRGVPLITVLFMSSIMLPLFLPSGFVVSGLTRAVVAIIVFTAAYIAEVVRGGLQMIPRGQAEAAASLGLGYWRTTFLVVLPQALRVVIPPLVNTFIEVFKDTTLVIIVGLFDLLNTTRSSILEIIWRPYYVEVYLFSGLIYFFFCFFMSHISQRLEHRLSKAARK